MSHFVVESCKSYFIIFSIFFPLSAFGRTCTALKLRCQIMMQSFTHKTSLYCYCENKCCFKYTEEFSISFISENNETNWGSTWSNWSSELRGFG